ncbi:MFS transporter [Oceanotoga teriensis]|uniref:MFS transporter n=2 Tax=Oceanotoga teriensis TaxID=515440 RepID=A0AA45C5J5_9BACT|nr:MFS transporter [Oceanotoga teriensis]PWJ89277.1 MFS transporter [Oceanotoga teriensis]
MKNNFEKDKQYYKFCMYGFFKNLRFFEPFFMLFLKEKGLSFTEIGSLYAIREILINLLEIPTGIVADGLGRRRSMIFSFLSYIVSFFIFYVSKSFFIFIFAMIFYSFGETFRSGTHKAMIMEYLSLKNWKDYKVEYYGNTRSWSQIGSAISSIIAAILVLYAGNYSMIFLASIIPYFIDLINLSTYPKELDGDIQKINLKDIKLHFKNVFKGIFNSFKNKEFLKAIINSSFYAGYYKSMKDFLQPIIKMLALNIPIFLFLNDQKRVSIFVGIVYFILYILTAISSKNSSKIVKKYKTLEKPLNLTMIIGLLSGMMSGIFFVFELYYLSTIFFFLIYIIENLRKPIAVSKVSQEIDLKSMATGLSTESQFETIFTAIMIFFMGLIADISNVGISLIVLSIFSILISNIFRFKISSSR